MFGTCKLGFMLVAAGAVALLSGGQASCVPGDKYSATSEMQRQTEISAILKLEGKELLNEQGLLTWLEPPAANGALEEEKLEEEKVDENKAEEYKVIEVKVQEEFIVIDPPPHLPIAIGQLQPLAGKQPQNVAHEHERNETDHENSHKKLDVILALKDVKAEAEVEEMPAQMEHEVLHNHIAEEAPTVQLKVEERREHKQQAENDAEEVPVGIPHRMEREQSVQPAQKVENAATEPEKNLTATIIKNPDVETIEAEVVQLAKDVEQLLEGEPLAKVEEEVVELAKDVEQLLEGELPAAMKEEVVELAKDVEQLLEGELPAAVTEEVVELARDVEQLPEGELPTAVEAEVEKLTKGVEKLPEGEVPTAVKEEVVELARDVEQLLEGELPTAVEAEVEKLTKGVEKLPETEVPTAVETEVVELTKEVQKPLEGEVPVAVEEEVEQLTKDAEKLLEGDLPVAVEVEELTEELTKHGEKLPERELPVAVVDAELVFENPVGTQNENLLTAVDKEIAYVQECSKIVLVVKTPDELELTKETKKGDLVGTLVEEVEIEVREVDPFLIGKEDIVKATVVQQETTEVKTNSDETMKAEDEHIPQATAKTKDVKIALLMEEIQHAVETEKMPQNAAKPETEERPFPDILNHLYASKDQFLFTNMKTNHEAPKKAQHATDVDVSGGQAEESYEYEIIIKRVLKVKEEQHEEANEEEKIALTSINTDSNFKIVTYQVIELAPQRVAEPATEKYPKQFKETLISVETPAVAVVLTFEPESELVEAAPELPTELIEASQADHIANKRAACASGADYEPNPNDCSRFLQCNHGYVVDMYCDDGLYWDAVKGVCGWSRENCFKI